jgi:hypothetical protein
MVTCLSLMFHNRRGCVQPHTAEKCFVNTRNHNFNVCIWTILCTSNSVHSTFTERHTFIMEYVFEIILACTIKEQYFEM